MLAVGGNFTSVSSVSADCLAFWDGSIWQGATNVRGPVAALNSDVSGPLGVGEVMTLDIGGNGGIDHLFSNDPTPSGSALYNLTGQTFALEDFNGFDCFGGEYGAQYPNNSFPIDGTVYDMLVWDDGSGEKLYIVGDFAHWGGSQSYRGVLVVDTAGAHYSLGQGTGVNISGERLNAIAVHEECSAADESIYFAGTFEYDDGVHDHYDVVRFGCEIPLPTVVSSSWALTNTLHLADANAAHYSDVDDALYVGRRNATFGTKGLYRLDFDDTLTSLWQNTDIAGIDLDSAGHIYCSNDFGGEVSRIDHGTTSPYIWVNGWHADDDDPIGLAIAPPSASRWFGPADAFMVDRGNSGLDEVWRWSVGAPQGETVLHADNGTLVNAIDITCSNTDVWICDAGNAATGRIYRVLSDGSLTLLPLSDVIETPVAIEYVFARGLLYVLDGFGNGGLNRLVSVDPITGEVNDVITGFQFPGTLEWASLDVTYDGSRMFISDGAAGRVYEFTSTLPCPPGDGSADQSVDAADRVIVQNDAGCDEPVNCDCVGDMNGDCRTDFSDIGIVMSNWGLNCPESNPLIGSSISVSAIVYPTPWPEPAPDGGVYYTLDLLVDPEDGDEWTGADATASILGGGTFWDDPAGTDSWQPTQWFTPGTMNLEFDSFYQPTHELSIHYPYFFTTPVNLPQQRDSAWFHFPLNHADGPYVVARYTLRLDDAEAADNALLTAKPSKDATPYLTITGDMITHDGGGSKIPFDITIYSLRDCPADLNGDGDITIADYLDLASSYGIDADGDIDGDNDTDRDDLTLIVEGWLCPDDPEVTGGPVSHAVVAVDNTPGNSEAPFNGGVTHFTHDLQISMGDDYWTTTQCAAVLTEPGFVFFQHPIGSASTSNSALFPLWESLPFDSFFTVPGIVQDGPSTSFVGPSTNTSNNQTRLWATVPPHTGEGTIARYTIVSPEPIDGMSVVPQGTAGPNTLVIGTITGDSTLASTGIVRHAFAFDIVVDLPPCPADVAPPVATDGIVGIADLLAVIGAWGPCPNPCTPPSTFASCPADVNDDCIVGIADLLGVIGAWGACF